MRQHNWEVRRTQFRDNGKAPIVEVVGRCLSFEAAQGVAQHEALKATRRIAALCKALNLPFIVKQRQVTRDDDTIMRIVHAEVYEADKRRPDRGVIFFEYTLIDTSAERAE